MGALIKVAVGQAHTTSSWEENADQCVDLITRAAGIGAGLIVLPEAALVRATPGESARGQAIDGAFVSRLAEASALHEIVVVVGTLVPSGGRVRNTGVVIRHGRVEHTYEKLHLYDAFGFSESDSVEPGAGPIVTFEFAGLTFGLMICYDVRFPEMGRALADEGVDVLLVPAAWFDGEFKLHHWRTLCCARALENGCFLLAAGSTGPARTGHSLIVDPRGQILTELNTEVAVATAFLDPELIRSVRRESPMLSQRRFRTTFDTPTEMHHY